MLPPWRLSFSTLFQSLFGYSAFFDWGFLNNVKEQVTELTNDSILGHYGTELNADASHWMWASISSMHLLGGLLMCLFSKYPMDKLGRRNSAMVLKNMVLIPAFTFQLLARLLNSIELLMLGRLLSGASIGLTVILPTYVGESSPTQWRSIMTSLMHAIGVRLWILAGAFCGMIASEVNWNYLFIVPLFASIVHMISTPLFPKYVKQEVTVSNVVKVAMAKMDSVVQGRKREVDLQPTPEAAGLKLALTTTYYRWPFILCTLAYLMLPLSGGYISMSYSTGIFESVGLEGDASLYTVMISLFNLVLSTICALTLIPWLGCRFLLLLGIGLAGIGTSLMALNSVLAGMDENVAAWSSLVAFVFINAGLNIGPGILATVLPSELAPVVCRSVICSLAAAQFFALSLVVVFIFPPINEVIGPFCFIPLAFCNIVAFGFYVKYLPETKNLPIDEVVKRWKTTK